MGVGGPASQPASHPASQPASQPTSQPASYQQANQPASKPCIPVTVLQKPSFHFLFIFEFFINSSASFRPTGRPLLHTQFSPTQSSPIPSTPHRPLLWHPTAEAHWFKEEARASPITWLGCGVIVWLGHSILVFRNQSEDQSGSLGRIDPNWQFCKS